MDIQTRLDVTSLMVTILLAFIGYLVTYVNNLRIARRRERLELLNKRISEFYGPLYVATQKARRAYQALVSKRGKRAVFDDDTQLPTESELAEWRVWMETVFMPNNKFIERLIMGEAYLIREQEMPECLLQFITHVSGYRAVLDKWQRGDTSETLSVVDFPEELDEYALKSYQELKSTQLELIGRMK